MEKPQECYPLGLKESDRLSLQKLDFIIFQNEEIIRMNEETRAALAELAQDIDSIETGVATLNDKITGEEGALAAKDARIAELEKQVAADVLQDEDDKKALEDLKAADEAATQELKDTLVPIVSKAGGLASKFQAAIPPVEDPAPVVDVPAPVVDVPRTPIEDQG